MKELPPGSESFRKRNAHLYPGQAIEEGFEMMTEEAKSLPPVAVEPDLTFRRTTDEEKLNQTEQSYLRWRRMLLPEGAYLGIQNITLKLAWDCRFTPDFSYIDPSGRMTFVDCKAVHKGKSRPHVEDDARAKLSMAARQWRMFRFVIAYRKAGEWVEEEVKP